MSKLADRILAIRKDSGLSQSAFGEKLNLSQNFVWMIEKGQREPSDRTVSDICRVYGVNETWLRTGAGEMHVPLSRDAQLAKIFATVQVSDDERARLVKAFASLPEEAYHQLYRWFQEMAKNLAGE